MRFTKEFKLNCVKKYQRGGYPPNPRGCNYDTFKSAVRKWSKIYDSLGEVGFEHKKPKRSWEDKFNMIQRVLNGESFSEVALSNGIQPDLLIKWYKIYQESGVDGLKLVRQGRPSKMAKKPKTSNEPKTIEELEKELEYLRAENEYLKKLYALVQKRKGQQPKKK